MIEINFNENVEEGCLLKHDDWIYNKALKLYFYKYYIFNDKVFNAYFSKGRLQLEYNFGWRRKNVFIPLELKGEELNRLLLHEIEIFKKELKK